MDECPTCGKWYDRIGTHWQYNPTHRPKLSNEQMDILTGIMMSDGTLMKTNKNARIKIDMVTKEYLEWLQDRFGVFASDISVCRSEEKAQKIVEESFGYESSARKQYRIIIKGSDELNRFRDWYSSGEKVWPKDIELSPNVLKHLYCGDGNKTKYGNIRIGMSNESENKEKVKDMFRKQGLPEPKFVSGDNGLGSEYTRMRFRVDESEKLWTYMGDPLPGFEYKWPSSDATRRV